MYTVCPPRYYTVYYLYIYSIIVRAASFVSEVGLSAGDRVTGARGRLFIPENPLNSYLTSEYTAAHRQMAAG